MPDAIRIPSLRLTELDGSPDIQGVERIYLTNGTLSNLGGGGALLSLSGTASGGSLNVQEVDGSPSVNSVTTIRVPNTTLTNDGGGQVTLAAPLALQDIDGTPNISNVSRIYFTNGNLSDLGGGSALLSLSGSAGGGSVTVQDIDGSPSLAASTIQFNNGLVTNSGGGVASLSYTAGIVFVQALGALSEGFSHFLYHHGGDNTIYYKNSAGTAWLPMDNPGWPRANAADDQEWEGANADPPAAWSWDNQDGATVDVNNTIKSHILLGRTTNNTATRISVLYRNLPITTSGKRVYASVRMLSNLIDVDNASYFGLALRNSANARVVFYFVEWDSSFAWNLGVQNWTTTSSFSANVLDPASTHSVTVPSSAVVLSVRSDGTTLNFEYAPLRGGVLGMWQSITTATLASFIGTWDQIGYGIRKSTGTTVIQCYSDWLRVV